MVEGLTIVCLSGVLIVCVLGAAIASVWQHCRILGGIRRRQSHRAQEFGHAPHERILVVDESVLGERRRPASEVGAAGGATDQSSSEGAGIVAALSERNTADLEEWSKAELLTKGGASAVYALPS